MPAVQELQGAGRAGMSCLSVFQVADAVLMPVRAGREVADVKFGERMLCLASKPVGQRLLQERKRPCRAAGGKCGLGRV